MARGVLDRALLEQPARVAARQCARMYLRRVLERAPLVEVPTADRSKREEDEPVHDFRVALRRLRSWLRAWRPELGDTVHRRTEHRLRDLSRVAGHVRDLEVQRIAILEHYAREEDPPSAAAGARWMADRAGAGYRLARRELATTLFAVLGPVAARLERELDPAAALGPPAVPAERLAREVVAGQLAAHVTALPALLRRVRSPAHATAAHETRISVRRFRYALDALDGYGDDVAPAVRYLTDLQERLGNLHDSHVLEAQLSALLGVATTPRAGAPPVPVHELTALREEVRSRIATEFEQVRNTIASPERRQAMNAVRRVIKSLSAEAAA